MTRPKNPSRYPVSSFGPELMALLIEGSKKEVRVPCPDRKFMRALQQRIHMLRGAMAREQHPQYVTVTRARTSQAWKINERDGQAFDFCLYVRPQDSQYLDALTKAGVKVDKADSDNLLNSALPPAPSNEVEPTQPTIEAPSDPDIYNRFKS